MLERGKMDRGVLEIVDTERLVPKEHLLRKADAAVDFNKIHEVELLYSEDRGPGGAVQNGADPASVQTAVPAPNSGANQWEH